jgi:hypothetical protein
MEVSIMPRFRIREVATGRVVRSGIARFDKAEQIIQDELLTCACGERPFVAEQYEIEAPKPPPVETPAPETPPARKKKAKAKKAKAKKAKEEKGQG